MLSIYIVSLNFCDYSRSWPASPRRVSRKKKCSFHRKVTLLPLTKIGHFALIIH